MAETATGDIPSPDVDVTLIFVINFQKYALLACRHSQQSSKVSKNQVPSLALNPIGGIWDNLVLNLAPQIGHHRHRRRIGVVQYLETGEFEGIIQGQYFNILSGIASARNILYLTDLYSRPHWPIDLRPGLPATNISSSEPDVQPISRPNTGV
jgi:hypothetical protein